MGRLLTVLLCGVSVVLMGCGNEEPQNNTGTEYQSVAIGFSAPLSGPEYRYGKDYRNGVLMAIEDVNSARLVMNGKQVYFDLTVEDDQASPSMATWVARKFVDKKVRGVIGHLNSGTSIPASHIYAKAGIPMIAMATAPAFTQQGLHNTFRSMTSDTQQGRILGDFVVKQLNAKKIAVIDDRTAYGQGLADEFVQAVEIAGAKVVSRQYSSDHATDFTAILTSIKRNKPEIIFFGGADGQSALLVKQMRQLGMHMPLASGEMSKTTTFLKLAGKAGEGTIVSLAGLPVDKMPKGEVFAQRYKERFKEPVGIYAPYGYDAARVMVEAIKAAKSIDPKVYLPFLAKIEYQEAVTTPLWAYDAAGNLKKGGVSIFQMEKGQWRLLEEVGEK